MPSGFAPAPPVAIRSGVAGWKPSGISAARVERPCALASSSFPSRLNPADTSLLRSRPRKPKASLLGECVGGEGALSAERRAGPRHYGESTQSALGHLCRVSGFWITSGHVRETQRHPYGGHDLLRGKAYPTLPGL